MTETISKDVSQYSLSQKLIELSAYTQAANNVLHRTQIERGMSALFISSQGKVMRSELPQARKINDEMLSAYRIEAEKVRADFPNTPLSKNMQHILNQISQIQSMRQRVDGLTVSLADEVKFYTQINHGVLDSIAKIIHLSAREPSLWKKLTSLYYFSQAKERAGIIRAQGGSILALKKTPPQLLAKLIANIAENKQYLKEFLGVASEDTQQKYESMTQSNAQQYVNKTLSMILSSAGSTVEGNSKEWFQQITRVINNMREIEIMQVQQMLAQAHFISAVKLQKLVYESLGFIAVFVLTILIGVITVHYLVDRLQRVVQDAKQLAQGDFKTNTSKSSEVYCPAN